MADRPMPVPIWAWPLALLAGAFLINAVPHAVMGLTGQAFPTIFSGGPPNLSSAAVNVSWSAINLAAGVGLLCAIRRWTGTLAIRLVAALGALAFGLVLANAFSTMM
jgi:hypothetical protein